jgi:hypothetical protein
MNNTKTKPKPRKWVELWDYSHTPREMIRIVYNPYGESVKTIIADWIPKDQRAGVRGFKTNG